MYVFLENHKKTSSNFLGIKPVSGFPPNLENWKKVIYFSSPGIADKLEEKKHGILTQILGEKT